MKSFLLVAVAAVLFFAPTQNATAQSSESPVPLAVLKDADGKVIAPLADIAGQIVMFNFGGITSIHVVDPTSGGLGQQDHSPIYFSGSNCTGSVYFLPGIGSTSYDTRNGSVTTILGPHPDYGTYQVFRTTTFTGSLFVPLSRRSLGDCENLTRGSSYELIPATEVLPNPLEGFHGPTTANPARVLTIEGGTRLP